MANNELLFETLTEFAQTIVGRYAIADVLSQLTDRVVVALSLDGAGVSVSDELGNLRFVTAAPADLITIEQAQEELQEGPCVSSWQTGEVIIVEDLRAETRWPEYAPVAVNKGYGAVASIPLRLADGCMGSLNCYSHRPRAWSQEDTNHALLFADMAASYVSNASELQRSERIREQLQMALDSRVIIEQAKGVLASRHHISIDQAYDELRRYTRNHNAHLHEIANAVVNLDLEVRS